MTRRSFRFLAGTVLLAAGLFLSACDSADCAPCQDGDADTPADNPEDLDGQDQGGGVCGAMTACQHACASDDTACYQDCYANASVECRTCYNEYWACLYDYGCLTDGNAAVDPDCFDAHCATAYDICFLGDTPPDCRDGDRDGYGLYCAAGRDCNDRNDAVHPGAAEVCNGADDDCDGLVDEKMPDCLVTRQWGVLLYMAGDNNLSDDAINEMVGFASAGGTTGQVGVALEMELSGQYSSYADILPAETFERTWRMVVPGNDLPEPQDLLHNAVSVGDTDFTDPANLTSFLNWAKTALPARHYLLVLWDHGGGFKGGMVDEGASGLLSTVEMAQALAEAQLQPDVVAFSACLMGMVEVAAQLAPYADYLVASQELSYGMPLDQVIAALHDNPDLSPEEVALLCYDTTDAWMSSWDVNYTIAAHDLSRAAALVSAMDDLGDRATENLPALRPCLDGVLSSVQTMSYHSHKDLAHLADLLAQCAVPEVAQKARAVADLATDPSFLLASHARTSSVPPVYNQSLANARGLSVFFPAPVQTNDLQMAEFRELALCHEAVGQGWCGLVENYLGAAPLGLTTGNFTLELTWTMADGSPAPPEVDLDLLVYEPLRGLVAPFTGLVTDNGVFSDDSLVSGLARETYTAKATAAAGSYYVFVRYQGDGDPSGAGVMARLAFSDLLWDDNDQVYNQPLSPAQPCFLGQGYFGAEVQYGRCSDVWLVGKLVRDDRPHTLLRGTSGDYYGHLRHYGPPAAPGE